MWKQTPAHVRISFCILPCPPLWPDNGVFGGESPSPPDMYVMHLGLSQDLPTPKPTSSGLSSPVPLLSGELPTILSLWIWKERGHQIRKKSGEDALIHTAWSTLLSNLGNGRGPTSGNQTQLMGSLCHSFSWSGSASLMNELFAIHRLNIQTCWICLCLCLCVSWWWFWKGWGKP